MIEGKSISAVLFIRNEEKYISQMLDSILQQIVQVDKIVIVDDFSTDKTKVVIDKYILQGAPIKYLENTKRGKAYACEIGLENAKTDLFFTCHGDDVLKNNYVESMYHFIKKNNIQFVFPNYYTTDENLNIKSFMSKKYIYSDIEILKHNYIIGYLFADKAILNYLLPFTEGLLFEDWYIAIKLAAHFKKIYVNNKPLFFHRKHRGATTANSNRIKSKYLFFRERDLKLFSVLSKEKFLNEKHKKVISDRCKLYSVMVNYTFTEACRLLFRKHITIREKVKILFFPLYLKLKFPHQGNN